jgi:hypothetical protein
MKIILMAPPAGAITDSIFVSTLPYDGEALQRSFFASIPALLNQSAITFRSVSEALVLLAAA